MNRHLEIAVIAVSLLFAAWSVFAVVRDRPPDRRQFAGLALVELLAVAVAAVAVARLVGGGRPGELFTFIGYLLTSVLLAPAAGVLARLEPTRWGSAILLAVFVTMPVLMIRMQQLWGSGGG
jgi:hypothetical protein